ncbi:MAG: periplasmic heavy metal sensor [Chlorobiaceae bacterium]|nr:periplasmic heavy metal sensor [Chlorobiaceae bacterium]
MKKTAITTLMIMTGLTASGINASAAVPTVPGSTNNGAPSAEARPSMPCEPRMWHNRGQMGIRMNERLNLNQEQRNSFRELRRKFFDQSITERRDLMELRKELAEESFRRSPDQNKISTLADRIGREHTKLAKTQSRFFSELSSILTPEQLQTFMKMRENRFHGV